eukprot:Partr_v1_DN28927_c4_g1_i11_m25253 putative DAZ interacting protein
MNDEHLVASADFQFKKRREAIDWRLLSSVNMDKLVRERDIVSLQKVLENVTFCDIEKEAFDTMDPNFIKLFQLSQLIAEYLLHCQSTLVATQAHAQNEQQVADQTRSQLTANYREMETQLAACTKENRALKKTVYAFQLWSKIPGGVGNNANPPVAGASTHYCKCRYCEKVFSTDYYLDGHLDRRHGDQPNYVRERDSHPVGSAMAAPVGTPAMDMELLDRVTGIIEKFSFRVLETEKEMRHDLERRIAEEVARKEALIADTMKQASIHHEKELQDLKVSLSGVKSHKLIIC